jgi:uncharacterized membrane protein
MALGPLQLAVIGFDAPALDGSFLGELAAVRAQGLVRLIDALGVQKDNEGAIWSVEVSDLPEEEAILAGAAIGALIGQGVASAERAGMGATEAALAATERGALGISPENILTIADRIPTGGAALLMLVEHTWLIPLRDVIYAQGGVFIANDFLSTESLIGIGAELAELDDKTT